MSKRTPLEEIHALAMSHGGKCLTTTYKEAHIPLKWECAKGHQWESCLTSVKNQKTWCSKCWYEGTRLGLEEMQELAKSYKGKCLSSEYKDNDEKLLWECERGHQWWSAPRMVKSCHVWCQTCPKENLLNELKEIAQSRNGILLEDTWISNSTKMKFKCLKCENIWQTSQNCIKNGSWCPQCARDKLTTNDLVNIARHHQGELLSSAYRGRNRSYEWRCHNGHQWTASINDARFNWCSECRNVAEHIQEIDKAA